jgi:hypothetical protein
MKRLTERMRWWLRHPRFELIYLLGGVPKEHFNVIHYRNVGSIIDGLVRKIEEANV